MCGICGCSEPEHRHENHGHDHNMAHQHHDHLIAIEENILMENERFAQLNHQYFKQKNMLTFNVMSSPGSGKTTLLGQTNRDLQNNITMAVIVGDQHSDEDAKQLQASGATAIQVNTGKVCHLDAHMIGHAVDKLPNKNSMILFIENVGNLVCPSFFNLGEHYKIVILSVTEGDNKPLKYPEMFRAADLVLITKMDLLPYVDFDLPRCSEHLRRLSTNLDILPVSAKSQQGLDLWYEWLKNKIRSHAS